MQRFSPARDSSSFLHRSSACAPSTSIRPCVNLVDRIRIVCRTAAGAAGDASSSKQQQTDKTYQPFPRMRESDPYKLLGVSTEADFEEIVTARNYLMEEYRWHEPSRDSIELSFDSIINNSLKFRNKTGFRASRTGRGGRFTPSPRPPPSLLRRIEDLFDPTVTFRTFINEGIVFIFLALWVLCSSGDPSFPLAGAVAYSVHKFLSKRTKANPQGPFLGGNPVIGAILSTAACLALSFSLAALSTAPLRSFIEGSVRQVGGFIMVVALGAFSVYLK